MVNSLPCLGAPSFLGSKKLSMPRWARPEDIPSLGRQARLDRPAQKFAFRTPDMFTPEEAAAIDSDIAEGLRNGTYKLVSEAEVAMCLARRPEPCSLS